MRSRQGGIESAKTPEDAARRRFLRTAVVGGVSIVGAMPIAASVLPGPAPAGRAGGGRQVAADPLLDVLQKYGSELGGINRVR